VIELHVDVVAGVPRRAAARRRLVEALGRRRRGPRLDARQRLPRDVLRVEAAGEQGRRRDECKP
jgi:hypothetical protein